MKYQKELVPTESFEEFCDVMGKLVCMVLPSAMNDLMLLLLCCLGLLGVIEHPAGFIAELLASVA